VQTEQRYGFSELGYLAAVSPDQYYRLSPVRSGDRLMCAQKEGDQQ
jgi:hypothetical protein